MILLELLTINLVLILVIDMSGFVPEFKQLLSKLLTKNAIATDAYRIKPFDCSYCMTFWCCMLYLLVTQQFTCFTVLLALGLTHFTDVTRQMMLLIKDILIKLIDTIYDKVIETRDDNS